MSIDKDDKPRAFLAGAISISGDIPAIETKSFTCTPIHLFKKGDKVAAMMSDDGALSVAKLPLQVGASQVAYPNLAIVKSSGAFYRPVPALLKTKTDIKSGVTVRLDGYTVETRRTVKSGDIIAVLIISDSLLSAETAEGAKGRSETQPWFAAYKDATNLSDRAASVNA
jgi:hypothetical protein